MKKNDWQSMNLKALNQNLHLDIGILLFDDVELLDFAGPYEVFCMANVVVSMQARDVPPFLVFNIADKPRTIRTRAGLRVLPGFGLEDCPNMDLLVVPGGPGVRQEMKNGKLIDCLINFAHLNRRGWLLYAQGRCYWAKKGC